MVPPKSRQDTFLQTISRVQEYDPDNMPPRFSFRLLIKHHNFGFESLTKEQKVALANTLYQLSQCGWSELRRAHRHGKGYEQIERTSLKFKLPDGVPHNSTIIAFRFFGKAPMLGFRSDWGTFYVIAFDTKYLAYSH